MISECMKKKIMKKKLMKLAGLIICYQASSVC